MKWKAPCISLTLVVTIRITNRCDFLYYVFISFFFSSFSYMFLAFMGPSSGVFQVVVFKLPFGSCSALLIVCVRQRTGLWRWLRWLVILFVTHIKDARYEKPNTCCPIIDNWNRTLNTALIFKLFVPCIFSTYGMKTNWCHYFIRILLDLYMFRTYRPIFRRVRTAVHTTIGSVSVPICSRAEHANRAVQILNQWLCEQLYELSWRWACRSETCRDPAIYE